MLSLVALAMLAAEPSLATLHEIAVLDLRTRVKAEDRPYTRHVSLHALAGPERDDFTTAWKLGTNGASIRGAFAFPTPIAGGRLLRFDLRGLGWDRFSREIELEKLEQLGVEFAFKSDRDREFFLDIWEFMGYFEPYFVADGANGTRLRGWLNPPAVAEAKALGRTDKQVIAAHWLLPRLLTERKYGGFYSQLLLLPAREADLEKRLGVFGAFVKVDPRAIHGAAVPKSNGVAHNPREVQFLNASSGYDVAAYMRTRDVAANDRAAKDVRESPAGTVAHDATEIIFTLPNGTHGAWLGNGKGEQQALAPQEVAEDTRPTDPDVYYSPTKSVFSPGKCWDCHGQQRGVLGFQDGGIRLINPPRRDTGYLVIDHDPKRLAKETQRIEEFYRAGLAEKAALIRDSYDARIRACTGLPALDATRVLLRNYDRFATAFVANLVAPDQAAREYALPIEAARALWKAASEDPEAGASQLGFLAAGESVSRLRWEQTLGAGLRKDGQLLAIPSPIPTPFKAK